MPIAQKIITYTIDLTDLGRSITIPTAGYSAMTIQIESNGAARSTGVLTLKRGNNGTGEFQTWEGGAVTFTATGFHPSTEVYKVAGMAFASIEVTTAEAGVVWLLTVYLNDSLALTKALT